MTSSIIDKISLYELVNRIASASGKRFAHVSHLLFSKEFLDKSIGENQVYKYIHGHNKCEFLKDIINKRPVKSNNASFSKHAATQKVIDQRYQILLRNIHELALLVPESSRKPFSHELMDCCNIIYFSSTKLQKLRLYLEQNQYLPFMEELFTHAINFAEFNSPVYIRDMLYDEAIGFHLYNPKRMLLLEKAMEYDHEMASLELGGIYYSGTRTVQQDYAKALSCFKKAKNNGIALWCIGWMYETGKGVQQSYKEAKSYYEESRKKGYPKAFNSLGKFYAHGLVDGQINESKAKKLFEEAIRRGNISAIINLGGIYERQWLASDKKSDHTALKQAFDLFFVAADYGNPSAQNKIGEYYFYGLYPQVCKPDLDQAKHYFEQAVNNRHPKALYNLGKLLKIQSSYKMIPTAIQHFKKALDHGIHEAALELALIYIDFTLYDHSIDLPSKDLALILAQNLLNDHAELIRNSDIRQQAQKLKEQLGAGDIPQLPPEDLLA